MVFKRNNTEWLHISHGHVKAFIKALVTDALINKSASGKLKEISDNSKIPNSFSNPKKDPSVDFIFESNGDLLFQGYLVIEAGNLPALGLELTKYAFQNGIFTSEPHFAEFITKLHN